MPRPHRKHRQPPGRGGLVNSASLSESTNQDRWSVPRKSEVLGADLLLPAETIEIRREARAFADRVLRGLAHELNTRVEREDP